MLINSEFYYRVIEYSLANSYHTLLKPSCLDFCGQMFLYIAVDRQPFINLSSSYIYYMLYYMRLLLAGFIVLLLSISNVHGQTPHIDTARTRQKAQQALRFCRNKGYNTQYCILIDMSLPSGINRFVVWDFSKSNIRLSGLVSHGCGANPWSVDYSKSNPKFSNEADSHCTSLGKYGIHSRGYSQWGIHVKYALTGLEKSNSNALARQVVLHSWNSVPEKEVYPNGTPEGWGCPAISNHTMQAVDALIRKQRTTMLLWIYS